LLMSFLFLIQTWIRKIFVHIINIKQSISIVNIKKVKTEIVIR